MLDPGRGERGHGHREDTHETIVTGGEEKQRLEVQKKVDHEGRELEKTRFADERPEGEAPGAEACGKATESRDQGREDL